MTSASPPIKPNMSSAEAREYIKGEYRTSETIHIAAVHIAVELAGRLTDRAHPIKSGDATERDLREAAFSIVKSLKDHQLPITDVELLMLELAMGVRRFGSQPRNARKEGTKFIKAQVIEAEWLAAHDEPMSENKLSKEVGVTRRTIGRWREDHEYRASLPTLIECEKMILEMRRRAM